MRCLIPLAAVFLAGVPAAAAVPVCSATVVASHPHDPTAFTEGLLFRDGLMFESTGYEGRSVIRAWRLVDGKVVREARLPPDLFGEGIVDWHGEIISLTWRSGQGFRWDLATLRRKAGFRYDGEGWGITQDGHNLIRSDGTATLRFVDPASFSTRRTVAVTTDGQPVANLNELEWVKGEILANVWQTDLIARIDPRTGAVRAWYDLSRLHALVGNLGGDAVLNGIAWDRKQDRLYVTGKNWPKLYEIKLDPC